MMIRYQDTRTVSGAHDKHRLSGDLYSEKVWRALKLNRMSDWDIAVINGFLSSKYRLDGLLPASHAGLRYRLFRSLLSGVFEQTKIATGEEQAVHITVVHRAWCTGDLDTEMNLNAIKSKLRRALEPYGLSYLAVIEVEVFRNVSFEERGRMMCFHVHALAWGNLVDRAKMQRELMSQFEVPISTLGSERRPVKSVLVQWVTPTEVDVAWVLQYGLKSPWEAMNLYLSKDRKRSAITHSEKSDRMVISLRLAEILSMIELPALVSASGDGAAIRRRAVTELKAWAAKQSFRPIAGLSTQEDVLNYWAHLKEQQGLERFGTPVLKV